jgi:hypothetical protein
MKEVEKRNVKVLTKTIVKEIQAIENKYKINTNNDDFIADFLVFATGSAPKSWRILQEMGLKIIEPVPSLFTFNIQDELLVDIPGTSFELAEVKIKNLKAEEQGPLLITHWGLSGPAILKLSAWKAREFSAMDYQFEIEVNFIAQPFSDAEEMLKDYKDANPKKTIGQSKIFAVTQRFWNRILEVAKINSEKQISQLNKKEIQAILENICTKKLQVHGKSTFKDEFVTAGGVDLKEIDFKTMAAKSMENFYLSGEVLNIDAITGGFNFQACWSEGWIIAQNLNLK